MGLALLIPAPQLCFWGDSPSCPTGCVGESSGTPQKAPSPGELPSWTLPRLQCPQPGEGVPFLRRRCHSWGDSTPFSSLSALRWVCLGIWVVLGSVPEHPFSSGTGCRGCLCVHVCIRGVAMGWPDSKPSPCGLNLPCLLPGTPDPLLSPRWDMDSVGHSLQGWTPPAGQPSTLVLVPGWPGFKSWHGLPSCVT